MGSLDSSLDLCSVSWGHSYHNWTGRSKKPSFLPWHRLLAGEPAFPSKQPLSLCGVSIGTLQTSSFRRNENFLNAWCLGSKKMKVETAWLLRDQELAQFHFHFWSKQVMSPEQNQGERNRHHFLKRGWVHIYGEWRAYW